MEFKYETVNNVENARLIVKMSGKINIENSEDIKNKIKANVNNAKEVLLDFSEVDYVSSAGLRMLLDLQKTMNEQKSSMYIKNVNDEVKNVFEITGFKNILNIV